MLIDTPDKITLGYFTATICTTPRIFWLIAIGPTRTIVRGYVARTRTTCPSMQCITTVCTVNIGSKRILTPMITTRTLYSFLLNLLDFLESFIRNNWRTGKCMNNYCRVINFILPLDGKLAYIYLI